MFSGIQTTAGLKRDLEPCREKKVASHNSPFQYQCRHLSAPQRAYLTPKPSWTEVLAAFDDSLGGALGVRCGQRTFPSWTATAEGHSLLIDGYT